MKNEKQRTSSDGSQATAAAAELTTVPLLPFHHTASCSTATYSASYSGSIISFVSNENVQHQHQHRQKQQQLPNLLFSILGSTSRTSFLLVVCCWLVLLVGAAGAAVRAARAAPLRTHPALDTLTAAAPHQPINQSSTHPHVLCATAVVQQRENDALVDARAGMQQKARHVRGVAKIFQVWFFSSVHRNILHFFMLN